jgi:hypothetical protein
MTAPASTSRLITGGFGARERHLLREAHTVRRGSVGIVDHLNCRIISGTNGIQRVDLCFVSPRVEAISRRLPPATKHAARRRGCSNQTGKSGRCDLAYIVLRCSVAL